MLSDETVLFRSAQLLTGELFESGEYMSCQSPIREGTNLPILRCVNSLEKQS